MVKIDLITGFLGSGKTTFIKKYAGYLVSKGYNVGILENDYGAVNVDMMLLADVMGDNCHAEMVAGGCGEDCHRRRFKTKLIAMGMSGYDRVIVEPSGIFDMDEFFDTLHEEPLDRWYEVGSIITIMDAEPDREMSKQSRYVLASEAADCGVLVMSKTADVPAGEIESAVSFVNEALAEFQCRREFSYVPEHDEAGGIHKFVAQRDRVIAKDWSTFGDEDFESFMNAGYSLHDHMKLWFKQGDIYSSVYIMNKRLTQEELLDGTARIFADRECGDVFRVKGFMPVEDGWIELNATRQRSEIRPIANGQEIIIVIGSELSEERIKSYFDDAGQQ